MNPWFLSIPVAYLLGSIPFGYLLVRIFRKQDIRNTGSGNIGATNVARSGAKGLGVATLLLDMGKGVLAVLFAFYLVRADVLHTADPYNLLRTQFFDLPSAAALAAVLGHIFPVWLGFRGGKGVATALGVFLALTPRSAAAILCVFAVVLLLTRYVSLASIAAAASFPLFAWRLAPPQTAIVAACYLLIPLLIILKHFGNIRRLLRGTENRLGGQRKVTA